MHVDEARRVGFFSNMGLLSVYDIAPRCLLISYARPPGGRAQGFTTPMRMSKNAKVIVAMRNRFFFFFFFRDDYLQFEGR